MSQVNDYAGNSIAGTLMSTNDAARMLHDLLCSLAPSQAQNDEPLPGQPSYSYTQHAHPPSFQIPRAARHPSWAYQGTPSSTVAPQDTWISNPAQETLTGLPSYQGRYAIGMPQPPVQPYLGLGVFATGLGVQTVPQPFEQADEMSVHYPYYPSAPPVSHFPSHITASESRDGRSGNPICLPSPSAPEPSSSFAPIVPSPPLEATAPQSRASPSAKTIYLPPTYDNRQGKKVHRFRLVSVDSTTESARTTTQGKASCTPVNDESQVTDLDGRITYYNPHHPMAQPIRFGAQLALYKDNGKKKKDPNEDDDDEEDPNEDDDEEDPNEDDEEEEDPNKANEDEKEPKRYRCRYIDPTSRVRQGRVSECKRQYQTFTNWQRHFLSKHVKDEHVSIQLGALDVSRAVAVKHHKAAIQVIECCSCGWRSEVGDRLDMVWKRHLMSEHHVVLAKKDDKPSSNKRRRDEGDDEPSVNKKPRRKSNDRPSNKKKSRQASETELQGPPQVKKRRTQKRR